MSASVRFGCSPWCRCCRAGSRRPGPPVAGHIVDPADGSRPDQLLSVTVVGPSLLWADVLATAAFVRGRQGLDLVERVPGYEAVVVNRTGFTTTSGLEEVRSDVDR
jgi:thiamine biosynthesis lipoprotein ApbE